MHREEGGPASLKSLTLRLSLAFTALPGRSQTLVKRGKHRGYRNRSGEYGCTAQDAQAKSRTSAVGPACVSAKRSSRTAARGTDRQHDRSPPVSQADTSLARSVVRRNVSHQPYAARRGRATVAPLPPHRNARRMGRHRTGATMRAKRTGLSRRRRV